MANAARLLAGCVLLAACGGVDQPSGEAGSTAGSSDGGSSGATDSSGGVDSSSGAESSTTGASSESSGSSSGSESGTTTGEAACGNGVVEDAESCDDGNDVDGDGCNRDCVASGELVWLTEIDNPMGLGGFASAVASNAAGDIATVGSFASSDQGYSLDIFTATLSSTGEIGWVDVYDSALPDQSQVGTVAGTEYGADVVLEDDGEVVVVGQEFLDPAAIFVRKYDAAGAEVWTRTGMDTADGFGAAIALGPGGELYVGAALESSAWLRRYNGAGADVWTQTPVGPGGACVGTSCNGAFEIAADAAGFVLAGTLDGNATFDQWVARYDSAGAVGWTALIDEDGGNDYAWDVALAGDGAVYALGSVVEGGMGETRLRRFEADGTLSWTLQNPGPDGGFPAAVAAHADGSFTLVATDADVALWLGRFESDSAVRWETTYPMAGVVQASDLEEAVGGRLLLSMYRFEADDTTTAMVASIGL